MPSVVTDYTKSEVGGCVFGRAPHTADLERQAVIARPPELESQASLVGQVDSGDSGDSEYPR